MNEEKVAIKAVPLGVCAGVNYADLGTREWLRREGPGIILGNMVNNNIIVDELREAGGTQVDRAEDVPMFSDVYRTAHDGSDSELMLLRDRKARVIDFSCPLVENVYTRFGRAVMDALAQGLIPNLLYLCKPDFEHREVKGVVDQFRDYLTIVPHETPIDSLKEEPGNYYVADSQTTMNAEQVIATMAEIRDRIPSVHAPSRAGVCFATANRQAALRRVMDEKPDLFLVFGSTISSNTKELVVISSSYGVETKLLERGDMVTEKIVSGKKIVAVTGGASVPIQEPNTAMDILVNLGYKSRVIEVAKEPDFFADKVQPRVLDFRNE